MTEMFAEPKEPEIQPETPPATSVASTEDPARAAKLRERRYAWQWNWRLLSWTIGLALIVGSVSALSYWYHSTTTASSFMSLANKAHSEGDFDDQIKWLERYSMLRPDDQQVIVDIALAAEAAADEAKIGNRRVAIDDARKQLSKSLRLLSDDSSEPIDDLRRRLIKRLVQLGGFWMLEAEKQTIALDAPPLDPAAMRWMTLALVGQVNTEIYKPRDPDQIAKEASYWKWLSNQPPGHVLLLALDENPDNLDLISVFLVAVQEHPELFERSADVPDVKSWVGDLKQRTEDVIAKLQQREESRAKWLLYRFYDNNGKTLDAVALVVTQAPHSFEGLSQIDATSEELKTTHGEEVPDEYWDYVLLMEAARRTAETNPDQAREWYRRLLDIELKAIPIELVESVFDQSALLEIAASDSTRAVEIWGLGLERSPNCLQLHVSLTSHLVQAGDDDELAGQAVDQLRSAIDFNKRRVARLTDMQLPRAVRTTVTRGIEAAEWRLGVMEAFLASRRGETQSSIARLTAALDSNAIVEPENRVRVANQLAMIHSKNGVWDQVASALERGLYYAPDDADLRARVAGAWRQAGNRLQAMEQWRLAGASASAGLQIAGIEALFNYQLRLAPEQRDFSGVRSAISRVERKLPARGSLESADQNQALDSALAMLEVLKASTPPPAGEQAEAYLQSDAFADLVLDAAQRYPDETVVQVFAAERLASAGRISDSELAVQQLQRLVGAESTPVAIVKARILMQQDEEVAASDLLAKQSKRDPVRGVELLQASASMAATGNEIELACQRLIEIPEAERSLTVLFTLAKLAANIDSDAELLRDGGRELSPEEFGEKWLNELRKKEGEEGTFWRYIIAMSVFEELLELPGSIPESDARVEDVRRLVREIVSRRPRWGEAVSMEGYLLAVNARLNTTSKVSAIKSREDAVDQLRRGIAAGDRLLQTRYVLISLLRSLGQFAEADAELMLASYASDAPIDEYSTIQIDLAKRQGRFDRGIQLAETKVDQDPDNFRRHLILGRALLDAGKSESDSVRREELLAQAEAALKKADSLSSEDEVEILSSELELALARGDRGLVDEQVLRIDNSQIDLYEKHMLTYRALNATQRYEEALVPLLLATEIRPSVQLLLAQAELNRRLDRSSDQERALRQAYELSPENERLRSELARVLVARNGADSDWDEIERLLSGAEGVSWQNRLHHAALLYQKGSGIQKRQAIQILRELSRERNETSDDAKRLLAVVLIEQLRSVDPNERDQRKRLNTEIRSVFLSLTQNHSPKVMDLYQFANYLMEQADEVDLPQVERLARRLGSMENGALFGLEVGVRHAERTIDRESLPQFVDQWASEVRQSELMTQRDVSSAAGVSLLELGFVDLGLEYFEQSYQDDPDTFAGYVLTLARAKQFDKALQVCIDHYETWDDVSAVAILVEVLTLRGDETLAPKHAKIIQRALQDAGDDVRLLENLATLRLQQNSPQDAIALYQRVLKVDPVRIRTLNNLAMALAETPGRASEGIEPIERAIKAAGELPELLDTMGVVLLKAGKPGPAKLAFQKAFAETNEPRFQFHLIMTLVAQKNREEAKKMWALLDLKKLDPSGLTASEQAELISMKKEFGT